MALVLPRRPRRERLMRRQVSPAKRIRQLRQACPRHHQRAWRLRQARALRPLQLQCRARPLHHLRPRKLLRRRQPPLPAERAQPRLRQKKSRQKAAKLIVTVKPARPLLRARVARAKRLPALPPNVEQPDTRRLLAKAPLRPAKATVQEQAKVAGLHRKPPKGLPLLNKALPHNVA